MVELALMSTNPTRKVESSRIIISLSEVGRRIEIGMRDGYGLGADLESPIRFTAIIGEKARVCGLGHLNQQVSCGHLWWKGQLVISI